jgi:nucleoside-diphosphate-sugar epimerase
MRVFVTGATGYIGSALVEALRNAGHELIGLVRSEEGAALVAALGAEPVRGEMHEPAGWLAQATACDAAIHAALDRSPDGSARDRRALDALLDAVHEGARRSRAPRSLVYTSDVLVLGATGGEPAGEDRPPDPPEAVAWRPAHEEVCLRAATELVATAVVRPGMVYGGKRGGHLAGAFTAGVRGEAPTMIGDGMNRWAFVHRDDLAALYVLIVEKRARGVFHGVDGSAVRVTDVFGRAARAAGGHLPPLMIPVEGARQNMGALADAMSLDQVVVAPRAAALGWRPAHGPLAGPEAHADGEGEEQLDERLAAAFAEWRGQG